MKKITLLLLVFVASISIANAQECATTATPILPGMPGASYDITIPVTDVGTIGEDSYQFEFVNAFLDTFQHDAANELVVSLTAPDGVTTATLFANDGGTDGLSVPQSFSFEDGGTDVDTWTGFNPSFNPPFEAESGPFNGEMMVGTFQGVDINGNWTLNITNGGNSGGSLADVCLTFVDRGLVGTVPTIECPTPNPFVTEAEPGLCSAEVVFADASAVDVEDGPLMVVRTDMTGLNSGDQFPAGTTVISFMVTDSDGNTAECDFTVIVNDNQDPIITCPSEIIVNNDLGECGAFVTVPFPTVTDNCGDFVPSYSSPITPLLFDGSGELIDTPTTISGAEMETGDVTIEIDYKGDFTSSSECMDIEGPDGSQVFFGCDLEDDGDCGSIVNPSFVVAQATWNSWVTTYGSSLTFTMLENDSVDDGGCGDEGPANNFYQLIQSEGDITLTNNQNGTGNASSFYPVGTTTVTFTAMDAAGNTVSCDVDITVIDAEAPTIDCSQADLDVVLDANGMATLDAATLDIGNSTNLLNVYALKAFDDVDNVGLYLYNPVTDEITLEDAAVSTTGFDSHHDLAYNPVTQTAYFIRSNGGSAPRELFEFDLLTGASTLIASPVEAASGNNRVQAMTFGSDGTMYLSFQDGSLDTYDIATQTATAFATVPTDGGVGLTFDYDNNRIIHSTNLDSGDSSNDLSAIDATTGAVSFLFNYRTPGSDDGCTGQALAYVGNDKILASSTFGCDLIYTIDVATGTTTLLLEPNGFDRDIKSLIALPSTNLDNCGATTIAFGSSMPMGDCDLMSSTGDPATSMQTWNRPIGAGPTISGLGPVSYDVYGPFTVDTDGNYTFTNTYTTAGYDGYIHLYEIAFDPTDGNQLTNLLAGDDDFMGTGASQIENQPLVTGTEYFIVTSGFGAGDFGDFTLDITGAGAVTCGNSGGAPTTMDFTCDDVGVNMIDVTVTDAAGNASTCTIAITVIDDTAPVVVCMDFTLELDDNGVATLDPNDAIDEDATVEACGYEATASRTDFSCADIGTPVLVDIFVIDPSGNVATCSATITVVDVNGPVLTCPDDQTVSPEANGVYTLEDFTGLTTATDGCDGNVDVISQSPAPGTSLGVGTYTITMTSADSTANESTCTFELTVSPIQGVGESELSAAIVLYPNPATEIVNLSNNSTIALDRAAIYNVNGQLVSDINLDGMIGERTIDVSSLASGVYMVQVSGENNVVVKRLIIE